ncbi:hypothetical protein RESH_02786 [Rhodopirellula europaea SH398]|uniref:Uncharacterized protein n=1 Tax=Rhodopirellula europaea SH398 TaxID=1263868 RepID=M5SKB8_9BACT|nr:hypothetical protein RESH_02786 [Rhodopirellula europaea SH398]
MIWWVRRFASQTLHVSSRRRPHQILSAIDVTYCQPEITLQVN